MEVNRVSVAGNALFNSEMLISKGKLTGRKNAFFPSTQKSFKNPFKVYCSVFSYLLRKDVGGFSHF